MRTTGYTLESAAEPPLTATDWMPFHAGRVLDRSAAVELFGKLSSAPGSQRCWRLLDLDGRQVYRVDRPVDPGDVVLHPPADLARERLRDAIVADVAAGIAVLVTRDHVEIRPELIVARAHGIAEGLLARFTIAQTNEAQQRNAGEWPSLRVVTGEDESAIENNPNGAGSDS